MTWLIYTMLCVLAFSFAMILQRILIYKDKIDPIAYSATFQGIVATMLAIITAIVGFHTLDLSGLWLYAISSTLLFGVGHVVYAKTLQKVEASVFSVLFATSSVWIMLTGIVLFGESLTIFQIAGSMLIFVSITMLVKNIRSLKLDRGTQLGLLTGLIFGLATVGYAKVGREVDILTWSTVSFAGAALTAFAISPRSLSQSKFLITQKLLPRLLVLGVLYAFASITMLLAFKEGSFSLVAALRQTGIVVTVLLALVLIPNERNNIGRKLMASATALAGAILIII